MRRLFSFVAYTVLCIGRLLSYLYRELYGYTVYFC